MSAITHHVSRTMLWAMRDSEAITHPTKLLPDPQSPIPNPQSPIPDPRSPIPDPQSPIPPSHNHHQNHISKHQPNDASNI